MGSLDSLCDGRMKKKKSHEQIWPHKRPREGHGLALKHQKHPIVATTEIPCHIICEHNGVCTKAVSREPNLRREPCSNISRAEALAVRRRGDLATASREAKSEVELALAFVLGVGRWRTVPLVGESSGVERCGIDWG